MKTNTFFSNLYYKRKILNLLELLCPGNRIFQWKTFELNDNFLYTFFLSALSISNGI